MKSPENVAAEPADEKLFEVLRQLDHGWGNGGWVVGKLGQGLHAHIYGVQHADRQGSIWESYRSVAVKLYKPTAAQNGRIGREEFSALLRLHTELSGGSSCGWKISVPVPLFVSDSPPALVMSLAPGKSLSFWLERGSALPEAFGSLPYAVIGAANKLWSTGRLHGDLTLDNILCDTEARELSFVDPGMRSICPFSDDLTRQWNPSSHDLAHILCDISASVQNAIISPLKFWRKKAFVEALLRAFVETISPAEERLSHLEEIRACARLHLMALGRASCRPRNLYQILQRHVGCVRVEKIISTASAEARTSPVGSSRVNHDFRNGAVRDLQGE